jgi:cardiolipin synthase A/B
MKRFTKYTIRSILAITCLYLGILYAAAYSPTLPQDGDDPFLYATQNNNDLKITLKAALQSAEKSILVLIYSCTDDDIIATLNAKASSGVSVHIVCDAEASKSLPKKLSPDVICHQRAHRKRGIMHHKVVVIDESQVWLGSTNLTFSSLRMHENLLIGLYAPDVAVFMKKYSLYLMDKAPRPENISMQTKVGQQDIEVCMLPHNPYAMKKLVTSIDEAEESLYVAMFMWTHQGLTRAITRAHEKGIDVQAYIDYNSGKGAGRRVAQLLEAAHIPFSLSQGNHLYHHKHLLIDDNTLFAGSANWTKSAFNYNDECMIILYDLTEEQRKVLHATWM